MSFDKSKYPSNWKVISMHIRARAGNKCEFCGVANGAIGARHPQLGWKDAEWWANDLASGYGTEAADGELPAWYPRKMTRIILTVAHLPNDDGSQRDKMDCREEVLKALCQKCHLHLDRAHHIQNARKTREQKSPQLRFNLCL